MGPRIPSSQICMAPVEQTVTPEPQAMQASEGFPKGVPMTFWTPRPTKVMAETPTPSRQTRTHKPQSIHT
jgi:hypothetical protein